MSQRVLDLQTLDPERPVIAIDGQTYELQLPDDFGLVELARIQRLQATVAEIMSRTDDLTEDDAAGLEQALDAFTALVLPGVPLDVRARLRDSQRLAIIGAFREAAAARGKPRPPA